MGPENFAPIGPTVQKLRHFFEVQGDFINFPTHQLLTRQLPTRQLLLYLTISPTITQEIPTRQPLLKLYQLVNLTNSSTRKQNVPTRQP